jgi:hypothetical protein
MLSLIQITEFLDLRTQEQTLATFTSDIGSMVLYNATDDKDLIFKGNDGGSTVTALTLDMSEGA